MIPPDTGFYYSGTLRKLIGRGFRRRVV